MSPLPLLICALSRLAGLLGAPLLSSLFWALLVVVSVVAGCLWRQLRSGAIVVAVCAASALQVVLIALPANTHLSRIVARKEEIQQPVSGVVADEVILRDGRWLTRLSNLRICDVPVQGDILFTSFKPGLSFGDSIRCIMKLRGFSAPGNPGMFDSRTWYHRKGIFGRGYPVTPVEVVGRRSPTLQSFIITLRKGLLQRIRSRFGDDAGLIAAVLVGRKDGLGEMRESFSAAGLSHLLAISGLHVGVLYLIMVSLAALLPWRWLRKIVVLMALILYCLLCSGIASVFRATVMLGLYVVASLFSRKVTSINILAAAFIVITLVQPHSIYDVGFQMSFGAVATLLFCMPHLRVMKIHKLHSGMQLALRKGINNLAQLMLVSMLISLFLTPITMHYFYQANFNGVVANLLAIPLFGVLLSVAVICLVVPPWLLKVYLPVFRLIRIVLDWWVGVCSRLPLRIQPVYADALQLIALVALVIALGWALRRQRWKVAAGSVLLAIAVVVTPYIFPQRQQRVVFFDCGLGDCVLLQAGETAVMIDTGPMESEPGHISGSVIPFLVQQRINDIDLLVITHAHNDHFGGLEALCAAVDVREVAITDEFQQRRIWPRISAAISAEGARVRTIDDTCSIALPGLLLQVLHPDAQYHDANCNNLSIAMRTSIDGCHLLFCGDMETEAEHYLVGRYPHLLDADVVKLGHHGSKTSSSEEFLQATTPQLGIISTSRRNRFQFPHPATLTRLQYQSIPYAITGIQGAVTLSFTEEQYWLIQYHREAVCYRHPTRSR